MADIRIDRYEFDFSNTSTQTIADVGDINKAFVRIVGNSLKNSAGRTDSTSNLPPRDTSFTTFLSSPTMLILNRPVGSLGTIKVMLEVWSYQGPPGGEYEFIIRQREGLNLNDGFESVVSTITGISDKNKCIPIYQGFLSTHSSTTDYKAVALACHINDVGQVQFNRNNTGVNNTMTVQYAIVEFIGSAWNVGHAFSNTHDTAGIAGNLITMNTNSTGTGGSIYDVTDWSTAMILEGSMGGDSVETGLADAQVVFQNGDTTTDIRLKLGDNNARNDSMAFAHILQADNLVVTRGYSSSLPEGNGFYGTDVIVSGTNASTPLSELSLEWFTSTTGTGTAWARGCLHAQLISHNTIQHWVHRSGNNIMANYAIVDLSALVSTQTNGIKYWDGFQFIEKPVKVWNGTTWETKPVKSWNGSSWI